MAKLQKKPKNRPDSTQSKSKSKGSKSDPAPAPAAVVETTAYQTQSVHAATVNQPRHLQNDNGKLAHDRAPLEPSRLALSEQRSSIGPQLPREERSVAVEYQSANSRPQSSRKATGETEPVTAGPSELRDRSRPRNCGPSCQKCGRPRKAPSPQVAADRIRHADATGWPNTTVGANTVPALSQPAPEEQSVPEAQQPIPTIVPDSVVRAKRRKYFSLPITAKKSTFKGPLELAATKGKEKVIEAPIYRESREHVRPYTETREKARSTSTPPPAPSSFKGPNDITGSRPLGKSEAHVHFAADQALGPFAREMNLNSILLRAPTMPQESSFKDSPNLEKPKTSSNDLPLSTETLPKRPPKVPIANQINPADLYEWPLITTLINHPSPRGSRSPTPTHSVKAGRVSRKGSQRNSTPNIPIRKLSSKRSSTHQHRLSTLSYTPGDDKLQNGSRTGTPKPALPVNNAEGPIQKRPSLSWLRLEGVTRLVEKRPEDYSPSDYGSVDDNLLALPATPPADGPHKATSVWVDDLRPFSSSVIASLIPGLPGRGETPKPKLAVELPVPPVVPDLVDLPELSDGNVDEDWMSWGALPGSYGGVGMFSGSTSGPGTGLAELGTNNLQQGRENATVA